MFGKPKLAPAKIILKFNVTQRPERTSSDGGVLEPRHLLIGEDGYLVDKKILADLSTFFGYNNVSMPVDKGCGTIEIDYVSPNHPRENILSRSIFEKCPELFYAYIVVPHRSAHTVYEQDQPRGLRASA